MSFQYNGCLETEKESFHGASEANSQIGITLYVICLFVCLSGFALLAPHAYHETLPDILYVI